MSSKKPLVSTTEKIVREGIHDTETKPNVVDEASTHTTAKNKIDPINETEKQKASQSKRYKSIRNESNKGISLDKSMTLDKSRAYKNETEDTVKTINIFRYISPARLSDKNTNIEQPK